MTFIPYIDERAVIGRVTAAITASRSAAIGHLGTGSGLVEFDNSMKILSLTTSERGKPAEPVLEIVEFACALCTEHVQPDHSSIHFPTRRGHGLYNQEAVSHCEQLLEEQFRIPE